MAGRVVPFATSEQTLAAAVTAFLAQSVGEPGGRRAAPITKPSLGWCTKLGGDRPLSALTGEAVTVAVTAAKNADARINNRAKRPAAWPLPLLEGPRRRVPRGNHRARREVEWASVRDCYDDPHRRSLTGGDHSSSRLAPMTLTHRPDDEPRLCRHKSRPVGPSQWRAAPIA
jgi:hypothetical protein